MADDLPFTDRQVARIGEIVEAKVVEMIEPLDEHVRGLVDAGGLARVPLRAHAQRPLALDLLRPQTAALVPAR